MHLHFKTLLFSSLLSAGNSVLAHKTDAVTSTSSQHDEKTATDAAAFPVLPQLRFMKQSDGDESSSRRLGRGHHGWRRSKKAPELDGKTPDDMKRNDGDESSSRQLGRGHHGWRQSKKAPEFDGHDDVCPLEASLGKTIFFQQGPYCVKAELFPSGTMTLDTQNSDCTPENESTGTMTISSFVEFSKENKTVQFSGLYSGDLCVKENAQQTEEQIANVAVDQNTFTVDLSYPSCPEVDPVFLFGMDYKEDSCNECVPYERFWEEYEMGVDALYAEFKDTTVEVEPGTSVPVGYLLEESDILYGDGSMKALYFVFGSGLVSESLSFPKLCDSESFLVFTNDRHTDAVCRTLNIFESFCIGEASCDETKIPNIVAARGDIILNSDETMLAALFCVYYAGEYAALCEDTDYVASNFLEPIQDLLNLINYYVPGGASSPLFTAGYGPAEEPHNDNFVIGDGFMQFMDVILPEEEENYVAASLAGLAPLAEQYLPDIDFQSFEVWWFALETMTGYFFEKEIYESLIVDVPALTRTSVDVAVEIYNDYPCAHKLGHMAATLCQLPTEHLTDFVGGYSEYLISENLAPNLCEMIDEKLGCNGVVNPNDASGEVLEAYDCLDFLFQPN